jgi:hypothetical protein
LNIEDDLATISSCYGIYVIPAVFGFSLLYAPNRWPLLEPGQHIIVKEIEKLDAQTLLNGSFVAELFEQMDIIESRWGKIHGYLHFQGILNNAFHIRGQDIFLDMIDRPDMVHHFFGIICDVVMADMQASTPDTRVIEFLDICSALESGNQN